MNPIAAELNRKLEGTAALRLLSGFGRRIFFPRGIVAQASEAGARAKRFDATIGMAVRQREPMALDCVREQVPGLSTRELAAYAPTGGVLNIRTSWKSQLLAKNPDLKAQHCSLPMVIPGLTNGIFHAAELFLDEGDAVVMPDMHWDNYELIFAVRRQSEIHHFEFFDAAGRINIAGLDGLIADLRAKGKRKAAVLLNFPNNPTGYSPTRQEARELSEALGRHAQAGMDILAICDDAYFGLYYESDTYTQSLFALLSQAHENILALKVDGSTKEDFVWGFRLGFVTFGGKGLGEEHYQALQSKLTGSIRACISSSSGLGQHILQRAYADPDYHRQKAEAFRQLERRYQIVKAIIAAYQAERAGAGPLEPLPFNSGYFMAFRCRGVGAEAVRQALLDRGVGTIALKDCFLRVAYSAVDEQDLPALFREIFAAADQLAA